MMPPAVMLILRHADTRGAAMSRYAMLIIMRADTLTSCRCRRHAFAAATDYY